MFMNEIVRQFEWKQKVECCTKETSVTQMDLEENTKHVQQVVECEQVGCI